MTNYHWKFVPGHTPWLLLAFLLFGQAHAQTQVQLMPSRDNTMFEEVGSLTNGGGEFLFTGRILTSPRRRALLAFDLSSIPPGSTILSAELALEMSRTISGDLDVSLHRLDADWGEGTADAPGQEGTGTPAAMGDATWTHREFNTVTWTTPGGDFQPMASATTTVTGLGGYLWNSPGMVTDVQSWLDAPASNFGWLIIGDEAAGDGTAKRFNTRENTNAATVPILTVSFTPAGIPPGPPVPVPTLSAWGLLTLAGVIMVLVVSRARRGNR